MRWEGATTSEVVGDNSPYGRELRLEDSDSFRNFSRMELAMFDELLHKIRPRSAKQNTWYRQAIGPGQKDSSRVGGGYLYAVVTPHYRSRYDTSKNQTPCHRSRYVTASHRTPHIRHANAIDTLQKRQTYTLYIAGLKFA